MTEEVVKPTARNKRASKRFWVDEAHNVHAGVTAFKTAKRNRYTRRESNRARRAAYVGSAGLIRDHDAYFNSWKTPKPTESAVRARVKHALEDTMLIAMRKAGLA